MRVGLRGRSVAIAAKANIGHAEPAAGMTGLLKLNTMAGARAVAAPNAQLRALSPHGVAPALRGGGAAPQPVSAARRRWSRTSGGVSSFGYSRHDRARCAREQHCVLACGVAVARRLASAGAPCTRLRGARAHARGGQGWGRARAGRPRLALGSRAARRRLPAALGASLARAAHTLRRTPSRRRGGGGSRVRASAARSARARRGEAAPQRARRAARLPARSVASPRERARSVAWTRGSRGDSRRMQLLSARRTAAVGRRARVLPTRFGRCRARCAPTLSPSAAAAASSCTASEFSGRGSPPSWRRTCGTRAVCGSAAMHRCSGVEASLRLGAACAITGGLGRAGSAGPALLAAAWVRLVLTSRRAVAGVRDRAAAWCSAWCVHWRACGWSACDSAFGCRRRHALVRSSRRGVADARAARGRRLGSHVCALARASRPCECAALCAKGRCGAAHLHGGVACRPRGASRCSRRRLRLGSATPGSGRASGAPNEFSGRLRTARAAACGLVACSLLRRCRGHPLVDGRRRRRPRVHDGDRGPAASRSSSMRRATGRSAHASILGAVRPSLACRVAAPMSARRPRPRDAAAASPSCEMDDVQHVAATAHGARSRSRTPLACRGIESAAAPRICRGYRAARPRELRRLGRGLAARRR